MRASVAARGAAASTSDVVAREAGVSRGLLPYYFGSKERLLVEVVRRDCDERIAALEEALSRADSIDGIVAALVASLEAFVKGEPGSQTVVYEMVSASRHSDEIRFELAEPPLLEPASFAPDAHERGRVASAAATLARGRRGSGTSFAGAPGDDGLWQRFTDRVMWRSVVAATASAAFLRVLAIPASSLKWGDGALRRLPGGT